MQAIAATGLVYSADPFDTERQEISTITQKMLSMLFSLPVEKLGELAPDAKMHPTPKDVRGAVIENNQILLIREKNNGRWTLPGGFAESGLSAAENVIEEILEEASIEVVAKHLPVFVTKPRAHLIQRYEISTKYIFSVNALVRERHTQAEKQWK